MGWAERLQQLDAADLEASLIALRLPKKTEFLTLNGLGTIGKIAAGLDSGIVWSLPGIGRRTIELVRERLSLLPGAIGAGGRVCWQGYAVACGFELVPSSDPEAESDFLASFPEVIEAIIRYHENAVDRLILTERLQKAPGERMTLQEVAQAAPITVTRERVRQRQEAMLRSISNALLLDDYRELDFHFRDSFAEPWKQARKLFGEKTRISFGQFVEGLQQVWRANLADMLPNLPFITSILTSKAELPRHLRRGLKLHPRLLEGFDDRTANFPLTWLPLGKYHNVVAACGVETVGGLVEAAKSGRLPDPGSSPARRCDEILLALGESLNDEGSIDWTRFGNVLGMPLLPIEERVTATEFLAILNEDIEGVVRGSAFSIRAADIFRMRTCQPQETRKTLDQVARMLKTHGPSVKREESILLQELYTQLVMHDFTDSSVIYRPGYLRWWREAKQCFAASPTNYREFCDALGCRWDLPTPFVRKRADVLWAVFTRYPNGGRGNTRPPASTAPILPFDGGTVVLRGFRREH